MQKTPNIISLQLKLLKVHEHHLRREVLIKTARQLHLNARKLTYAIERPLPYDFLSDKFFLFLLPCTDTKLHRTEPMGSNIYSDFLGMGKLR